MAKRVKFWKVTREYLMTHNYAVFVFGDNLLHQGTGGAAKLRDMTNTHGFITKKAPNNLPESFYTPEEYEPVFQLEAEKLKEFAKALPNTMLLVSRLGAGLANQHQIFEKVIEPQLPHILAGCDNVYLLWD